MRLFMKPKMKKRFMNLGEDYTMVRALCTARACASLGHAAHEIAVLTRCTS